MSHPAKMSVALAYKILEHGIKKGYWQPGDRILDPLAGVGTTLICASTAGFKATGVELESHFVGPAQEAIKRLTKKLPTAPVPEMIQGDARQLSEILDDCSAALTSPPYAATDRKGKRDIQKRIQKLNSLGIDGKKWFGEKRCGDLRMEGYSAALCSPPYGDCLSSAHGIDASKLKRPGGPNSQTRIASNYSAVISSPPYAHQELTADRQFRSRFQPERVPASSNQHERYSAAISSPPCGDAAVPSAVRASIRKLYREGKIAEAVAAYKDNQRRQVDLGQKFALDSDDVILRRLAEAEATELGNYAGVVTSPPYSETHVANPGEHELAAHGRAKEIGTSPTSAGGRGRHGFQYSHDEAAQIGNLRDPRGDIDAVLSSPPYANVMSTAEARGKPSSRWIEDKGIPHNLYGRNNAQIGNKNMKSYLSAMAQVYLELYRVLKPGGIVCLVTKNPVKNGQIRRLDEDTIRLMEAAGFVLIERIEAMLTEELGEQLTLDGGAKPIRREHKSFFKRLFEAKHPDLCIDHEDVLFFRKYKEILWLEA